MDELDFPPIEPVQQEPLRLGLETFDHRYIRRLLHSVEDAQVRAWPPPEPELQSALIDRWYWDPEEFKIWAGGIP